MGRFEHGSNHDYPYFLKGKCLSLVVILVLGSWGLRAGCVLILCFFGEGLGLDYYVIENLVS